MRPMIRRRGRAAAARDGAAQGAARSIAWMALALAAAGCASGGGGDARPTLDPNHRDALPRPTPVELPPLLRNYAETVRSIALAYPQDALARGEGGDVGLWVFVDTTGNAGAEIEVSSGDEALDCAALQVSRDMDFVPAMRGGRPVRGWVRLTLAFRPEMTVGVERDPNRPACEPFDTSPVRLNSVEIAQRLSQIRSNAMGGVRPNLLLWVFVEADGVPSRYEVRESSGWDDLDSLAGEVLLTARFSPAKNYGIPTGVWIEQRVAFDLPPLETPARPRPRIPYR